MRSDQSVITVANMQLSMMLLPEASTHASVASQRTQASQRTHPSQDSHRLLARQMREDLTGHARGEMSRSRSAPVLRRTGDGSRAALPTRDNQRERSSAARGVVMRNAQSSVRLKHPQFEFTKGDKIVCWMATQIYNTGVVARRNINGTYDVIVKDDYGLESHVIGVKEEMLQRCAPEEFPREFDYHRTRRFYKASKLGADFASRGVQFKRYLANQPGAAILPRENTGTSQFTRARGVHNPPFAGGPKPFFRYSSAPAAAPVKSAWN